MKVREKIDIRVILRTNPAEAVLVIKQGATLLERWREEFHKTKMAIE